MGLIGNLLSFLVRKCADSCLRLFHTKCCDCVSDVWSFVANSKTWKCRHRKCNCNACCECALKPLREIYIEKWRKIMWNLKQLILKYKMCWNTGRWTVYIQVMMQRHNRSSSLSLYIAVLAVMDSSTLIIGRIYLFCNVLEYPVAGVCDFKGLYSVVLKRYSLSSAWNDPESYPG